MKSPAVPYITGLEKTQEIGCEGSKCSVIGSPVDPTSHFIASARASQQHIRPIRHTCLRVKVTITVSAAPVVKV